MAITCALCPREWDNMPGWVDLQHVSLICPDHNIDDLRKVEDKAVAKVKAEINDKLRQISRYNNVVGSLLYNSGVIYEVIIETPTHRAFNCSIYEMVDLFANVPCYLLISSTYFDPLVNGVPRRAFWSYDLGAIYEYAKRIIFL